MLRLTEIRLPLDHPESAIRTAILKHLGIGSDELIRYSIARSGHDARKRDAIVLVYTLDVEVKNEQAVLKRLGSETHCRPAPGYRLPFRRTGASQSDHQAGRDRHGSSRSFCRVDSGAVRLFARLFLSAARPFVSAPRHLRVMAARQARSGIQCAIR